jgi:hypothetical protein
MKKFIRHIILILVLFSCEEKIDYDFNSKETIRLVVEGMITNERKAHEVKLSLPVQHLNEAPQPVSGALVAITDQENVYILLEDIHNPGIYLTEDDIQGVFGKVYSLYIQIGEYEFIGSSYMVPVEPLQPINILPCPNDDNTYYVETEGIGDPFIMEIYLDWSASSSCTGNMCQAKSVIYHLNSIDVNEIFKPEQEVVCFPPGTVIKRKQFSLNNHHQSFVRAMMNETNWRGGLFDVERGNITTNMSQGAIGYFAAATVVSDSTYFQP